jgi:hypothetical protein
MRAIEMKFGRRDCLHCTIIRGVGRRLEDGEINGIGALDNLVRVMADVLATASIEKAEEMKGAIMQDLSEAEAHARQRTDGLRSQRLRTNEGLPGKMTADDWL